MKADTTTLLSSPVSGAGPACGGASHRRAVPPTWSCWLLGIAVGTALAAVVLMLRGLGVLQGPLALITTVIAVLLVPSSRNLSRRVLLAGSFFFGWVQVLWWLRLPVGSLGRVSWLLAIVAAAIGFWLFYAPGTAGRLRRLVPRVRLVDFYPFLSAVAAAWFVKPWFSVRSGTTALAMMMPGWDNVAHFGMFNVIHGHGAVTSSLPTAPDGTAWAYTMYPQGYHACAVAMTELLGSAQPQGLPGELAAYVRVMGLTMVAVVVLLTAGVSALPALRRRPALALPAVVAINVVFLLGPGTQLFGAGFANFVLAVALVVVAALIALSMSQVTSPVMLAALGGVLVGIAHNWIMLLVLAFPAVLIAVFPLRRNRWRGSRWQLVVAGAIALATILAGLRAVLLLTGVDATAVLIKEGGIPRPAMGQVILAVAALAGACLIVAACGRPSALRTRIGWLVLIPLTGVTAAVGLAVFQFNTSGVLSYYFWKFSTALEMTALSLVAVVVVCGLASGIQVAQTRATGLLSWLGASLLALGLTQTFGVASPPVDNVTLYSAPSIAVRDIAVNPGPRWQRRAHFLLKANQVRLDHPGAHISVLPIYPDESQDTKLAQLWSYSLTGEWTVGMYQSPISVPPRQLLTAEDAAKAATTFLSVDGARLAVVSPEQLHAVRVLVPAPLRSQVVSW